MIEGNQLSGAQVVEVIQDDRHFPGRERDEREVLGHYAAIEKLEHLAESAKSISESHIKQLHALVMGGGSTRVKPTPYRDGQNVIRDSRTRGIVYLPPEAKDVAPLMKQLVAWINDSDDIPCPVRAGIAHYQFATIHPYYDGNGRTARLLTTLILHLGGYDLKGLYSLEDYYARDLKSYYRALSVGPTYNYYDGRAQSDITQWVDYFCKGVADSFENVHRRAVEASESGARDDATILRQLDPRQRRALELFSKHATITSNDIAKLFDIAQRTARTLLTEWTLSGFVEVVDAAKKSRKYALAHALRDLVE